MTNKCQFGAISPIFRGPFLARVAIGDHTRVLSELADFYSDFSPPKAHQKLSHWFDFFYDLMFQYYRSEYVYKNTIATELYLKNESLQASLLTSELRVGSSRIDVVILNGTSTAYEIKSKYDSLDRLDTQLADYARVFDRIFLVTTEEKANLVKNQVDDVVGVMYLNDEGEFEEVKPPLSNKLNTDPTTIFNCMRQSEFREAVDRAFGYVPKVPNALLYRECIKLFQQLAPEQAHDLMVECVRKRGKRKPYVDLIRSAPNSLKHACLDFSRPQSMAAKIEEKLLEPLEKVV